MSVVAFAKIPAGNAEHVGIYVGGRLSASVAVDGALLGPESSMRTATDNTLGDALEEVTSRSQK